MQTLQISEPAKQAKRQGVLIVRTPGKEITQDVKNMAHTPPEILR